MSDTKGLLIAIIDKKSQKFKGFRKYDPFLKLDSTEKFYGKLVKHNDRI